MSDTKRLGAMSLDAVRGPRNIAKSQDDGGHVAATSLAQSRSATVGDRVDIGGAKELERLTALVTSENEAALRTIKQQLDDGTYTVDHLKLAERLVQELSEE